MLRFFHGFVLEATVSFIKFVKLQPLSVSLLLTFRQPLLPSLEKTKFVFVPYLTHIKSNQRLLRCSNQQAGLWWCTPSPKNSNNLRFKHTIQFVVRGFQRNIENCTNLLLFTTTPIMIAPYRVW